MFKEQFITFFSNIWNKIEHMTILAIFLSIIMIFFCFANK